VFFLLEKLSSNSRNGYSSRTQSVPEAQCHVFDRSSLDRSELTTTSNDQACRRVQQVFFSLFVFSFLNHVEETERGVYSFVFLD
jgi:hypothetical protein